MCSANFTALFAPQEGHIPRGCQERVFELVHHTKSDIVLDLDGGHVTPLVECGLLAGCYRAELLESGVVKERVLHREALLRARAVYFINSLGWM